MIYGDILRGDRYDSCGQDNFLRRLHKNMFSLLIFRRIQFAAIGTVNFFITSNDMTRITCIIIKRRRYEKTALGL